MEISNIKVERLSVSLTNFNDHLFWGPPKKAEGWIKDTGNLHILDKCPSGRRYISHEKTNLKEAKPKLEELAEDFELTFSEIDPTYYKNPPSLNFRYNKYDLVKGAVLYQLKRNRRSKLQILQRRKNEGVTIDISKKLKPINYKLFTGIEKSLYVE